MMSQEVTKRTAAWPSDVHGLYECLLDRLAELWSQEESPEVLAEIQLLTRMLDRIEEDLDLVDSEDAAASAKACIAVFEWMGETLPEYWRCTEQLLMVPGCDGCNQTGDDGGNDTLLRHKGNELDDKITADGSVPDPKYATNPGARCVLKLPLDPFQEDANKHTRVTAACQGMSDGVTAGVHRVRETASEGVRLYSAINVNDGETISKFDNVYGCWHPPPCGIKRTPYRDTPLVATPVQCGQCDAWSAGMVLIMTLSGKQPLTLRSRMS